jgi:hypothetical protein
LLCILIRYDALYTDPGTKIGLILRYCLAALIVDP